MGPEVCLASYPVGTGESNVFVEAEGRRPVLRSTRRWEDISKTDLKKVHCEGVIQDSLVAGCCDKGNEPLSPMKDGYFLDFLSG